MTANQVQIRRDTDSNLTAATPAAGEPGWNTTNKRLHMGDGATAGGIILPNSFDVQNQAHTAATAGGTANALTLALSPTPLSWATNMRVGWIAASNNTGAATLAITGLTGTKTIKKKTASGLADLAADDMIADGAYSGVYNGTYVVLDAANASAGIISVSQGDLSTSTGSGTLSFGNRVTLPGGEYGFFPKTGKSSANNAHAGILGLNLVPQTGGLSSGSYISYNFAYPSGTTETSYPAGSATGNPGNATWAQRYITASPPFDLGDGPAGGFIFLLLNTAGDVVAHYHADVPPWAYNGPTKIRADFIDPVTRIKYREVPAARSMDEIMDGAAPVMVREEITQAIKNADMGLIPHPFGPVPAGHSVVMLDPMDERVRSLTEWQNAAPDMVDLGEALKSGKIYTEDAPLARKGPAGLKITPLRYKYSRNPAPVSGGRA